MMHLLVEKTEQLHGLAVPPGSKSQTIRALFFSLFTKGESRLINGLFSDDTHAALDVCRALGAMIECQGDQILLRSQGVPLETVSDDIYTESSGITTRFVLPLLGLKQNACQQVRVSCSAQMQARPIAPLVEALNQLGMTITYATHPGRLPLLVSGRLKGGAVEIDGTTSQYLSALLMSLPLAEQDSHILVRSLNERPYVEMTLAWLKKQGIVYHHDRQENTDIFSLPGGQHYPPVMAMISGDFSAASCLLAAAVLLPGEVCLQGLDLNDFQGDKAMIDILKNMGATIWSENQCIRIQGGRPLMGAMIDANAIPDLLPALSVVATQALSQTRIYNVKQARLKETDRIHSMTEGLRRMGAKVEEHDDGMTIYPSHLQGAVVRGYQDHRTVMALAVAGLVARGETIISDAESINKTYPNFVKTLVALGARMTLARHIILIGFKHVGKSVIGRALAQKLARPFIDLDEEVEKQVTSLGGKKISCRQMMQLKGEVYYREQEGLALEKVLQHAPSVIALGGGTLVREASARLVSGHHILHIKAPKGIVFERIMITGRPAFFNSDQEPYEAFELVWQKRMPIYAALTSQVIDNIDTIQSAVNQAMEYLAHD